MSRKKETNLTLSGTFAVVSINKPNTFTKSLLIKVGDILLVRMAIANTTGASNVLYARYVDVFNLNSNIFKCNVSLNKFVNMIGTNFELEEK